VTHHPLPASQRRPVRHAPAPHTSPAITQGPGRAPRTGAVKVRSAAERGVGAQRRGLDAAEHGAPDIVDVFRKPSEVVAVVRDAIAAGAKAIWFQYGVINEEAIAIADAAGLFVVVDRCLKVESARFNGGLATSGLNSGLITSRRRG